MGINFPPSPTIGTLWPNPATAGVPQYTWNGTVWTTVLAPPAFYAQDTAPVGAPVNALWWDTDSGILFINYKDVSTTQWVATSSTPAVDTSGFATQTSRLRNRVVNGAMQISQEWGNTLHGPTATMGFFAADQWNTVSSTSLGTASIQRVQSRTPKGSVDRLRIIVGAAKTSLTAGDIIVIQQLIEGNNVADFLWGTASAKQVIMRFGFRGPAGVYTLAIRNAVPNRSYLANFTITAGQQNTDTEQVIVIPGDTQGVWPTDNALGMNITISLGAGTNHHGVLGWQGTGAATATATTSNFMAVTSNTAELFDVGLYLDADNVGVPPKWELPAYADELVTCQRYWEQCPFALEFYSHVGGEAFGVPVRFAVEKRVAPTLSAVFADVGGAGTNFVAQAALRSFTYGCEVVVTSVAAGGVYLISHRFNANARM